jgi:hypothetical protein
MWPKCIHAIEASAYVWPPSSYLSETRRKPRLLWPLPRIPTTMAVYCAISQKKGWPACMRIDGHWLLCDDGAVRPVIPGAVLDTNGQWQFAEFLVDTGADRTVFSAQVLAVLHLQAVNTRDQLGGIGGRADCAIVETQIRLRCEDEGFSVFRGQFAGVTQLEALDMSVLERDVLNLFAVIVDRARDIVCMLGQQHEYRIERKQS